MIPNLLHKIVNVTYVHSTKLDSADGDKRTFCLGNIKETIWGDSRHSLAVDGFFLSCTCVTASLVKFHVACFPNNT